MRKSHGRSGSFLDNIMPAARRERHASPATKPRDWKAPAESALLEACDVTKTFGGVTALDQVNLIVREKQIAGIVGPNGAGKTTLFGILSGLLAPTNGEVFWQGARMTHEPPYRRSRKGLARTFQRLELFWELTVQQNLAVAYRAATRRGLTKELRGCIGGTDAVELSFLEMILERLDLNDVADEIVATLPLGTCRLVEVGRALAARPKLLLLDEPSSGLDKHETARLADTLVAARDQFDIALVIVEHDIEMVLGISEVVTVLDFGEVIACAPPAVVRGDPRVQAAYLGVAKDPE